MVGENTSNMMKTAAFSEWLGTLQRRRYVSIYRIKNVNMKILIWDDNQVRPGMIKKKNSQARHSGDSIAWVAIARVSLDDTLQRPIICGVVCVVPR